MTPRFSLMTAFLFAMLVALTGCAGSDKFKVMDLKAQNPSRPARLMVRDFTDNRPREEKSYINFAKVPLNFYGGYFFYDRHDAKFPTQSQPFDKLVAQRVAERLAATELFEKVDYVPADQQVALGDYDVELRGTITLLRTRGRINYYGLSIFGDFLHYTAVPKFVRRWEIDVEYQLVDAYTGEPIADAERIQMITRRTSLSIYDNRGDTKDLEKKMLPAIDEYVTRAWAKLPSATDTAWVDLKARGAQVVASQAAQAQATAQSRKPRFRFLSPTDGDMVRGATMSLRWDVTAPGRVKQVRLVANNNEVVLGINPLDFAAADSAPVEIQPRDVNVPLLLGANKLESFVEDHIGQTSRATITLTRMPQPLTPARRFALLVGEGTSGIEGVLKDPMLGQFGADAVTSLGGSQTAEGLTQALASFGSRPVAGDLALIYVAGNGDWSTGAIDGGITLAQLLDAASKSIATENVLVVLDINWNAPAGDQDVMDKFGLKLQPGWALLIGQATGGASVEEGGQRAFGTLFVDVMKGVGSEAARLTVERLLDDMVAGYEAKAGGKAVPDSFGRYARNNTMVERQ